MNSDLKYSRKKTLEEPHIDTEAEVEKKELIASLVVKCGLEEEEVSLKMLFEFNIISPQKNAPGHATPPHFAFNHVNL